MGGSCSSDIRYNKLACLLLFKRGGFVLPKHKHRKHRQQNHPRSGPSRSVEAHRSREFRDSLRASAQGSVIIRKKSGTVQRKLVRGPEPDPLGKPLAEDHAFDWDPRYMWFLGGEV